MPRTADSGWSARAIAASIEKSVQDGRLQPAEVLPPVRELATRLKVSPAPVAAAYRLLRSRGLTAAHGRRGTRVIPRPPTRGRAVSLSDGAERVDLASGNPDPEMLPSLAAAVRALDTSATLYEASPHLPALMVFAAGELEADNIPARALTLASGALDGIERILREHLRPGDHVALEDPGFPALHDLVVAAGYVPVLFDSDDEGPIPASLESALRRSCRALVITTRAQNPTGSTLTEPRASSLRPLLRRYPDLLVIESDPCGPIAGAPLVTLIDPSRHRWTHVKSVAKFLGPDLRVAFIAGDQVTITRVEGRYALGPRRVSLLLQQLVLSLWSDPSAGRQLARAADLYAERRRALLDALSARGIVAHGVSGLNVWVPVRREGHVMRALADQGWSVAAGEPFRAQAPPAIRITVARLLPEDADRLAAAIAMAISGGGGPAA
jgi:DNA-binding transcriptional MocR family regulator